jgi:SAM-dependent methyltransferase
MSQSVKVASPVYSDRMNCLRYGISKEVHNGLEFGALNWPVYRPDEIDIKFVDFASTDELKRNTYASDPSKIVDVDYIWPGSGSLAHVVGAQEAFDFAIASHVIEHVPNVLGWFRGIREVLKHGGRLNLAIPDKRFTFDVDRKETTIAELVEADILDLRVPSIRQVFDHVYLGKQIDPGAIWYDERPVACYDRMSGINALRTAFERATDVHKTATYHEAHCSVFTPASFLSLMEDATKLGLFDYYIDEFVTTGPGGAGPSGFEFFVNLVRPSPDSYTQEALAERIGVIREDLRILERHYSLLA